MGQQMELDMKIKHSFTPNAAQPVPPLWIEEIRVYRAFNPEMEQCKYSLRPGMNILWADPGSGNAELYASGISGHAAGKTTFCRLIRYLLGEPVFGSKRFREHLVEWAPNAVLIGKVWLNGESWIVCRPLGLDDQDFAIRSERLEEVFEDAAHRLEYKQFFQTLEKQGSGSLLGRTLPSGDRQINWRRLLPWISRDQECRLSKLTVWRDPSSDSQTPETTLGDACYMIRCALKLVTPEEDRLYTEHRRLAERRRALEAEVPLLKYQAEQGFYRLKQSLNEFSLNDGDLVYAYREKLKSDLKALETTPEIQQQQTRLEEVDDQYAAAREDLAIAHFELKEQTSRLAGDRETLSALKGEVKKEQARQEMKSEDPAPSGRCNVPLWIAQEKGCPIARGRHTDFESHANIMSQDKEISMYEKQIGDMQIYIAQLQNNVRAAQQKADGCKAVRQRIQQIIQALAGDLEQKKGIIKRKLEELEITEKARRDSDKKEAELDALRLQEKESQKSLNELRRKAEEQKMLVNGLFEDITRAVLGKEVSAKFTAYADYIDLNVECRGDRESSATSTVQILAFDLAALLLAAEGESFHPGLLIHDSPREADMAPDVYQRFFLYLKEIEKAYSGSQPNFQYIITTTEPPPKEVIQKPWLIARLDASKPETRLLGVDLA